MSNKKRYVKDLSEEDVRKLFQTYRPRLFRVTESGYENYPLTKDTNLLLKTKNGRFINAKLIRHGYKKWEPWFRSSGENSQYLKNSKEVKTLARRKRKRTVRKKKTTRRRGKGKGWFGEPRRHRLAALKGLRKRGLKPRRKRATKRGLALDRAKKAKTVRKPWQPRWRGDLPGKRV